MDIDWDIQRCIAATGGLRPGICGLGAHRPLKGKYQTGHEQYTKAWEENPKNHLLYLQVCQLADEYYRDPEVGLRYYENLLALYPDIPAFLGERAKIRIAELREEIHYGRP